MRFIIILLLLTSFGTQISAQDLSKKGALSFGFNLTDYNTLDTLYQVKHTPKRVFNFLDLNYAVTVGYVHPFSESFSVEGLLRLGSADAYLSVYDSTDVNCQPCQRSIDNLFFTSLNALGVYNMDNGLILSKKARVAPFFFAGLGVNYFQRDSDFVDVQIPIGLGTRIKLHPDFALNLRMEYRNSLMLGKDNLILTFGFLWHIRKSN